MSTSNFHFINTLHAIEIDDDDEFIFDDTTENIFYDLEKEFSDIANVVITREKYSSPHELNSYGRQVFAEISLNIDDENATLALTRSGGYYSGANFDFDVILNDRDDDYPENITNDEPGIHIFAIGEEEKFLLTAIERVTKIYDRYTDKLNLVATFSNGEAVYEKSHI